MAERKSASPEFCDAPSMPVATWVLGKTNQPRAVPERPCLQRPPPSVRHNVHETLLRQALERANCKAASNALD